MMMTMMTMTTMTMTMMTMMITDRCPWQHFSPRLVIRNSKVRPDHDNDENYDNDDNDTNDDDNNQNGNWWKL